MAALHLPSSTQNPPQTFLDKKQPLMPRQSTSDVLSFTHIIANRLSPGQNVWDFFSPPENASQSKSKPDVPNSDGTAALPPISPTSPNPKPTSIMSMITPTSPVASSFAQNNTNGSSRRQSVTLDMALCGVEKSQDSNKSDITIPSSTITPSTPTPLVQPATLTIALATSTSTPTPTTPISTATTTTTSEAVTSTTVTTTDTPKLQKRRSFAQSLRNSMITLTQLLSPTSTHSSRAPSPTMITGPPHYNILVLGSDSAPLASTLYKMSSILPGSSKIRHYQEISGFFVAYFRSNDSFSCSPKISTDEHSLKDPQCPQEGKYFDRIKGLNDNTTGFNIAREGVDEVKSRRSSIQESEDDSPWAIGRSSEDTLLQLKPSTTQSSLSDNDNSTINSTRDMEEVLMSDNEEDKSLEDKDERSSCVESDQMSTRSQDLPEPESPSISANASLSIHAFSLDTTWPVPRILAQTFWFPFAHGIIYIVDATRKNDPRGVDHLLNARQFLSSLVADPHFKRKDIPIVVFANKAGLDPETCYRLDEIAEILGCEDWDVNFHLSSGTSGGADNANAKSEKSRTRPWCVKSTRADGAGDGIRESVEWLKSRMGEIWST
ncbi:hypothetical protein BGZ76_002178 [Entomortierella beljakovae]|nr:hypothetical protein BGZ76_002178 [Entomortierella beljakovae]